MAKDEKGSFVLLENSRTDEQRSVMEDIIQDGVCPFCPEHISKYHKAEILKRGEHWLLTYNQWPYENTELHLLAIATYHATSLADLKPGAAEELFDLMKWAEKQFNVSYGGICMRFGDVKRTGATVDHIHAHLIVPKKDLSGDEKVRFKIS